uniref:Uncharacterized protein n=1 Tax=Knipowitschia caucasica TaxID=637954 RepID=A0AAV2M110_KNICA
MCTLTSPSKRLHQEMLLLHLFTYRRPLISAVLLLASCSLTPPEAHGKSWERQDVIGRAGFYNGFFGFDTVVRACVGTRPRNEGQNRAVEDRTKTNPCTRMMGRNDESHVTARCGDSSSALAVIGVVDLERAVGSNWSAASPPILPLHGRASCFGDGMAVMRAPDSGKRAKEPRRRRAVGVPAGSGCGDSSSALAGSGVEDLERAVWQ